MASKKPEPTSMIRRRNYGKNHAYYLRDASGEERKLDGVTTLIGEGIPKPALVNWAGNVTSDYAVDHWDELSRLPLSKRLAELKGARFKDRDTAAQRGTDVHALAERVIAGEEVEVSDELAPHVNSAVRFIDEWEFEPILTETTVFSVKYGYAGTMDLVGRSRRLDELMGRSCVAIADWKTSRSGIYGEAALQLSAYANADFYQGPDGLDHPMSELGITDALGLWIRPDGYDVFPMDIGPETFKFFRFAQTLARRLKDDGLMQLRGEALRLPVMELA
jgi:hypothetical protein